MRPPFFPLRDMKEVMNRKVLIMTEFGVRFEDEDPVSDLLYFSKIAATRREEKRKAAQKGHIVI